MLLTIISLIFFNSVTAQSIVDRTQYYVGDTFNITCDITKLNGPLSTLAYLFTMSLMRQTLTETKFSTIAIYQPFAAPTEHNITTLPLGRQWIVHYSGGDGYTNRQTMKIVTTVVGLRCDDAGQYKCSLTFPGSLTPYESTVANLTVKAQISQDDMNVIPHNGDDPFSSSYDLKENENITITLTCAFRGPANLKAVWKFTSKDSNEQDYLPLNDIVDEKPVTTTSSGCTSSSYRSILSLQLQADHDGTTYFCTIVENNVEMSRANFTIVSGCPAGMWGSYCENTCDKKCYGTSCSQLNGECYEGCLGYEDPPNCNLKCRPGFYGRNCFSSCSTECVDNLCHYVNGQCLSTYNEEFSFDGKSFGIGVGVTVAAASICIISLFIYFKMNRPKTAQQQNAYNVPEPLSIDKLEYEQVNKTGGRNQSYYKTDPHKTLQTKNVSGQTNSVYDTID